MRLDRSYKLLLPAALLAGATPGAAEEGDWLAERFFTMPEVVADLAYGFCPLVLADQFPLADNPQLAERGFSGPVLFSTDAKFGDIQTVTAARADGTVKFGGAPGMLCNLTVTGADRDAVMARLKDNMSYMGLDMILDEGASRSAGGATIESYSGAAGEQVLHVQLATIEGADPALIAQLYITED